MRRPARAGAPAGLSRLAERVSELEMAQGLILFVVLLGGVTVLSWPGAGSVNNLSWYSLSPARNALLALAATGYGAAARRQAAMTRPGSEVRTVLALLGWALLTLPFEVVTYAATYPATPLVWPLLINAVTVLAFYGAGRALGTALRLLRASWLLPLAVPLLLVLLAWFDLRLEVVVFNPWGAVLAPAPYLGVAAFGAALTIALILVQGRRALKVKA